MVNESSDVRGDLERMFHLRSANMLDVAFKTGVQKRLRGVHERNAETLALHTVPFNPEEHDLPDELVHSMLLKRHATMIMCCTTHEHSCSHPLACFLSE